MKKFSILFILVSSFTFLILVENAAEAKPNDIALNRLLTTDDCPAGTFCEDQQAFRNLMREFGYAISPNKVLPAETHGFGGGFFGMLGHITFISNDESYWENGVQEKSPPKALFLYQASAQFVLIPYFLEWGFTLGYLFTTSDTTIGFNVRTSPFEGFRKKVPGAFPDISFGFGLNRLIGDDEISLTTGNADVAISYAFAPGGVIVLTPFVALSIVGVAAESELVDATPNVNAFDDPGHLCPIKYGTQDGRISCRGGTSPDYNHSLKFTREWIYFVRVTYGVRLIYELLSVSVAGSHGHQFDRNDDDPSNAIGQLSFSLGLDF